MRCRFGGIASGETIKEMYAGSEAMARVKMLLLGGLVGTIAKLTINSQNKNMMLPGHWHHILKTSLRGEPKPVVCGHRCLIGVRAGPSMLVGAVAAWCVFGPMIIENGWVTGSLMVDCEKITLLLNDPNGSRKR